MTDLPDSMEFRLLTAANPIPYTDRPAPDETLRERILAASPPARRRRRALLISGGSVAAVAALTGAAAATGLIPSGVTRAFESIGSSGHGVTDARMVAETGAADGIKAQIWTGHNANGGSCEYTRVVSPSGSEDGGRGCFSGPGGEAPAPAFVGGLEAAGRALPPLTYIVTARTTIASVSRIVLVFSDGATIPLSFNSESGYAIGVVPADRTTQVSELIAYDSTGQVVARQHEPATTQPSQP